VQHTKSIGGGLYLKELTTPHAFIFLEYFLCLGILPILLILFIVLPLSCSIKEEWKGCEMKENSQDWKWRCSLSNWVENLMCKKIHIYRCVVAKATPNANEYALKALQHWWEQ
jgi:hypothetical protein